MAVEKRVAIGSIIEAKIFAKRSNGTIPIAPCNQKGPKGEPTCPNFSKSAVCSYKDGNGAIEGVITNGGVLECPRQLGILSISQEDKVRLENK